MFFYRFSMKSKPGSKVDAESPRKAPARQGEGCSHNLFDFSPVCVFKCLLNSRFSMKSTPGCGCREPPEGRERAAPTTQQRRRAYPVRQYSAQIKIQNTNTNTKCKYITQIQKNTKHKHKTQIQITPRISC